jgi:hypothetical protein
VNVLPPNEQVLFKSPGGGLVLTTHRIRHEMQHGGSRVLISIMLEEVASCGVFRVHQPVLLAIAAISFILGVVVSSTSGGSGDAVIIGVLGALVLVGFYFASRQHVLVLGSAGATIRADVRSLTPDIVRDFIDRLEFAKNSRYLVAQNTG